MRPETYLAKLRGASKRELMATVMELARRCYDLELREPVAVKQAAGRVGAGQGHRTR